MLVQIDERLNGFFLRSAAPLLGEYARRSWEEFYPHYFRLRKLRKIGMNREKGSITHLKAVSGIKSLKALEAYLGYDQEAQDEAMEISE